MRYLFVFLALLLLYFAYTSKPALGYDAPVIELFISNSCGHCRRIFSEIDKLLQDGPRRGVRVLVFVKGENDEEFYRRNIQSFPTIIINDEDYNGERTSEAMLNLATGV